MQLRQRMRSAGCDGPDSSSAGGCSQGDHPPLFFLPKAFSVSESQAAVPSYAGVVAGKATPISRRPEHPSPPQDMVTLPGRAGP